MKSGKEGKDLGSKSAEHRERKEQRIRPGHLKDNNITEEVKVLQ